MARQRCCGLVDNLPDCRKFVPEGQVCPKPIILNIEELEAIRLKDHCELDQSECAVEMGLSRATFQRILASARSKIALGLIEGRTIIIDGGNYIVKNRVFECLDCGNRWEVEPCSAGGKHGYEISCPACGSMKKMKISEDGSKTACGGSHSHGHGACGCGGHGHK